MHGACVVCCVAGAGRCRQYGRSGLGRITFWLTCVLFIVDLNLQRKKKLNFEIVLTIHQKQPIDIWCIDSAIFFTTCFVTASENVDSYSLVLTRLVGTPQCGNRFNAREGL